MDSGNQPYREAVKNLSDTQIDALINGESVPLAETQFAAGITRFNTRWKNNLIAQRNHALANGEADPFPNGIPDRPSTTPSIRISANDHEGQWMSQSSWYGIHLDGISLSDGGDSYLYVDPMDNGRPPLPITNQDGPLVDLSPLLKGPTVTDTQRGDVGFTLAALAKTAHITLYQEHFFKTTIYDTRSRGLSLLKGTLPQLVNAICAEWRYQAVKVGSDYFFWSRTGAQDREWDISEPKLERWRQRIARQGKVTLTDRMEMASALSWPQVRLTLSMALPEAGAWDAPVVYRLLRGLSEIGPDAIEAAASSDGLAFAELPISTQQVLWALWQPDLPPGITPERLGRLQIIRPDGFAVGPTKTTQSFNTMVQLYSADQKQLLSAIVLTDYSIWRRGL